MGILDSETFARLQWANYQRIEYVKRSIIKTRLPANFSSGYLDSTSV
jgi:hypothetical protein